MALAIGVHASRAATSNTTLTTVGVNTQASGSAFVVANFTSSAGTGTVSDNKGNTYTQIGSTTAGNAGSTNLKFWYCQNGAGGTGHTWTSTSNQGIGPSLFAVEITGAALSGGPSGSSVGQDSSSPYTTPSGVSPSGNAALVAIFLGSSEASGSVHAESTGFTIQEDVTDGTSFWTGCLATRIVSAGSYNPSFTETAGVSNGPPFAVGVVAFDEFVAPVYVPRLMLLGVG